MTLRLQIEKFLDNIWGINYTIETKELLNGIDSIQYLKELYGSETLIMVVIPPVRLNKFYDQYCVLQDEPLKFFLYDKETDLIVGCISNIYINESWKKLLSFKIITAHDRMERSECPKCGFWLVEKKTVHQYSFMGCSGFPECDFTSEIDALYDD